MNRPSLIYVSGALTTGLMTENIRNAVVAGIELMKRGYVVIVPHEKALLTEILHPQSYDAWMQYDYGCILNCDAVWRLPSVSGGGDLEVAFAVKHGIRVYFSLDTLLACEAPTKPVRARERRPLWGLDENIELGRAQ